MSLQDWLIVESASIIMVFYVYFLIRTWPKKQPVLWFNGQAVGNVVASRMDVDGMHVEFQITDQRVMALLQGGTIKSASLGPLQASPDSNVKYHEDYDTEPTRQVRGFIPIAPLYKGLSKEDLEE